MVDAKKLTVPSPDAYTYVGEELDLFRHAKNWKAYWGSQVLPFVRGRVLEVGAGTGNNAATLIAARRHEAWTCLEPDPALLPALTERCAEVSPDETVEVIEGTLAALKLERTFDTLLYIDVLEHIERDHAELKTAAAHLAPGGHLIVLSPAHQALFSPFDKAVGHYRRYSVAQLLAAGPQGLKPRVARYLDAVGLLASTANRLLLRQSMPNVGQLKTWDRWMVPLSKALDPILGYRLGKSVLGVWTKEQSVA